MSERPPDPAERTGPIEPVPSEHVEPVETVNAAGGTTRVERVDTTHAHPPGIPPAETAGTAYTAPVASDVERITYASSDAPPLAERSQQRGILLGALAGVAALLLVAILWFLLAAPGRSGGGGQTNVNVAGGQSQSDLPDLRLSVNLTQQAVAAASPTSRPPTATARPSPTERPLPTSLPPAAAAPPAAAPPAIGPASGTDSAPAEAPSPAAAPERPTAASSNQQASGPVTPAGPVPAGWRAVTLPNNACQFAAPPDWQVAGTSALAPGDRATAALTSQSMNGWDAFKERAKSSQSGATTREDSADRLWLERQREDGSVQHYIARPAGNVACVLQIDVTRDGVSPLEPVIRQMADSLGAPS